MRLALALWMALPLAAQLKTTLSPKTTAAFEEYLKSAEPPASYKAHYGTLKPSEIRVDPMKGDGTLAVKDGIVHDWISGTFVLGATVEQAVHVLQDYAGYKNLYQPEVVDSKLLTRNGDVWHPYLKLVKSSMLTAVLNTEYDVVYKDIGEGRWTVASRSTRVAEIDGDRELPLGTGHGFVWRLNAYWLIEPRDGGVYLEFRSISLSRDIPFGMGFAIKPFVKSLPSDSVRATMTKTAQALTHPVLGR